MARQIILDTETTGLEVTEGHRIIEIGCVELIDRCQGESYYRLINPERGIDSRALQIHRITRKHLDGQPRFADICDSFLGFVRGAEILAHNAEFDIGFLDAELKQMGRRCFTAETDCQVSDTLKLARELHPNMHNRLNDLCRRYQVDYSMRDKHNALLDAELLLKVYLAMTSGQVSMQLKHNVRHNTTTQASRRHTDFIVIRATEEESREHRKFMQTLKRD